MPLSVVVLHPSPSHSTTMYYHGSFFLSAPINSCLNVVVRSPTPFGLGQNGCWPSRGSQLPRALPFIFSLCCPMNDRRKAAHSIYKIGRLFSLFLFSCLTLALLRLLILLLLMSGNVHPNPGSIFSCSVCAGNVTWRGRSVQCCTCSKSVHLRCSQLSLSKFRALGSSHSWSCFHCRNTVTPSLDSSDTYTSTVQSGPPLLMLHSCITLVSKPPILHLPILYSLPLPLHHRPLLLAVLLCLLPPLLPLTLSGFFNGMLEVSVPEALNYFTFSRPIQSTLSASRNPILTLLPLSGFSALRSDRTHSRSGTLTPDATHASGGVVIFVRQGLSFSELSTSSLSSLDPYFDYVGVNISLNNSSSVSFLNVYVPPICSSPTDGKTDSLSPSILSSPEISSFWGTSIAITPSGTQEALPTPEGRKYSTGSCLLTSSPSMTLTHPPFSIAFLAVAPLLTSPLLLLLLLFLAPGRCFRTWVLTIYQFFYPSLSLRSIAPTSVPHPSIFRKLAGMALPPTLTVTVPLQRNTRLFLFPLLLPSLPL